MVPVSIAIDGPAGAGKSTVAKMVAERLHFLYVDTGAMYRAVAFLCVQECVDAQCESGVAKLLEDHDISFERVNGTGLRVRVDNVDVTDRLRSPDVSSLVSMVAAHACVRTRLTSWQRAFAKEHSVVMDGRDIGSVVLPNATVKVFLTAAAEERALRRQREFSLQGFDVSLEEIIQNVIERDKRDSTRAIAPLMEAPDAVHIDSTGKSIEDVVHEILKLVEQAHVRFTN